MPRRSRRRAAMVSVLATAVALMGLAGPDHAAAQPPAGTPIVIGSLESQTGAPGSTGKVTVAADTLAAWAKWTNAHGGVAGHPVKVVVLNDRADPAQAKAALTQLVQQQGVLAIVGSDASTTEPTWKDYVDAQRVPVIGGAQFSANWFTDGLFYPVGTTIVSNVWGQVDAARNAGGTKLATVLCSNSTDCQGGTSIVSDAVADLGMTMVANQVADGNAATFTAQCQAMKAAGATAVLPTGINNLVLVRDCARQSFHPVVVTTNYVYSLQQLEDTPQLEGLVGPSPAISPYNRYPATKDFFAALAKYAPSYAPGGEAYVSGDMLPAIAAWQAARAFAKAVENSGDAASAPVTRADVMKGLSMFKGETLGGSNPPLTYTDGSSPNPQVKCFYLYKTAKGKYLDEKQGSVPKLFCQP